MPQAAFSPVSGALGDRYNRVWLMTLGTSMFGVFTALFGFANTFSLVRQA